MSQHTQNTNKKQCLLALNKHCCYVKLFFLYFWVISVRFYNNTNHQNNDILLFYLKLHSFSSHLWTHSTNQPICLYDAAGTFITLVTEKYKSKENMVCIFMELIRHLPYSELFLIQGVCLTQGSNQLLLHWQAGCLPLSHQGSPNILDGDISHKLSRRTQF